MISELSLMKRVIFALFFRELKTRFGAYRLGYLWIILEPVLTISIFVGIRGILGGSLKSGADKFIYHVDYPFFLASGLIPFFLFRNSVSQIMHTIEANRGLFAYQPVKPIDAILTRWILEGLIFIFVYIFIFWGLHQIGFTTEIKDPLGVIIIYFLFYLFSLGVGLIFCIIGNLYEDLQKVFHVILFVLFFISGIFFSIHNIPTKFQKYLLWNPILQFLELGRERLFPIYSAPMCDVNYVIISTIVSLFLGLILYKLNISKILASE